MTRYDVNFGLGHPPPPPQTKKKEKISSQILLNLNGGRSEEHLF